MGKMKHEYIVRGLVGCGFASLLNGLILSLALFFSATAFAQSSIEVIRDPRVDTLVSRYKEVHSRKESIDGYRIQIIAGSNRTNVYQVKSQFYKLFPDITQYLIYQAPNFKLRVGSYRTRLEAQKDLEQIIPEFKGAFIIRDEIKISEL